MSTQAKFNVSQTAPFWVQDNAGILRILHRFIDQTDKKQQPKIFVNRKNTPELFEFDQQAEDRLWPLITEKLADELKMVEIRFKPKLPNINVAYDGARLTFNTNNPDAEHTLRTWLERPAHGHYSDTWRAALEQINAKLPCPDAFNSPIKSHDFSATAILRGFVRVAAQLNTAKDQGVLISLRTLSARCFAGDSKFLDQRRSFIEHAFPLAQSVIEPRAIMLSVYIPRRLRAAIFVENFDSFRSTVRALARSPFASEVAVVYSAGYRSSANLIREVGHSQFVTINHVNEKTYEQFCQWWFSSMQNVPVLFWGDLDFEGMRILKSLRHKFSNTQAFKAAYDGVLNHHSHAVFHSFTHGSKGKQTDPITTGCDYADSTLLPAIRQQCGFTDQEVLSEHDIHRALLSEFS